MKFSTTMLALASVVALLSACETKTPDANGTGGTGGAYGQTGHDGAMGYLDAAHQVPDRVFFDYDSSVINAEGEATLQKQADFLKKNNSPITIEGHCDERGTREYNLALGERRAAATKSYLVNLGIPSGKIQTISYGKERPAVVGSDDSAYSQNRRGVTVLGN